MSKRFDVSRLGREEHEFRESLRKQKRDQRRGSPTQHIKAKTLREQRLETKRASTPHPVEEA